MGAAVSAANADRGAASHGRGHGPVQPPAEMPEGGADGTPLQAAAAGGENRHVGGRNAVGAGHVCLLWLEGGVSADRPVSAVVIGRRFIRDG